VEVCDCLFWRISFYNAYLTSHFNSQWLLNETVALMHKAWYVFCTCRPTAWWLLWNVPRFIGTQRPHQLVTEPSGMGGKDCAHPYSTIIASKHKSAINLRNLCHIDVLCLFFLRAFDKGFKNIACRPTLLMCSEILACTMDCLAFFFLNRRVTSSLISIL